MRQFLLSTPLLGLTAFPGAACEQEQGCMVQATDAASAQFYGNGDVIPADKVNVVLNTEYHGLPATDGSFWYVRLEGRVFRMDPGTRQIIEEVQGRRF